MPPATWVSSLGGVTRDRASRRCISAKRAKIPTYAQQDHLTIKVSTRKHCHRSFPFTHPSTKLPKITLYPNGELAICTRAIEIDLIGRFGPEPIESIDKFALQTHLNDLAGMYSQDRVKQARSYLKSIFDEAIEQEFLVKDPTRKLKSPKNLRPKDKQILTWEQLRAVLAKATRRDRILLMLDMTDALRP